MMYIYTLLFFFVIKILKSYLFIRFNKSNQNFIIIYTLKQKKFVINENHLHYSFPSRIIPRSKLFNKK